MGTEINYYKIRNKKTDNYYASHKNEEIKFSRKGKTWESYSAVLNCLLKIHNIDRELLSSLVIVEFKAKEISQIDSLNALNNEEILQPLAKILRFKKLDKEQKT